MSLNAAIRSIQDLFRQDPGVDGDAQRIAQLGWMLFFRIVSAGEDALERDGGYVSAVPERLRWSRWAREVSGEALLDLVDGELFPMLRRLDPSRHEGLAGRRAALLRAGLQGARNHMRSGAVLRQVLDRIEADLGLDGAAGGHVLGDIYERLLEDLQSAGNAGEFYTPRAVTRFVVDVVDPQPGEIVLDPACGTGGFLVRAWQHLAGRAPATDLRGVEKKPLPHLLALTNLLAHGVEVPSGVRLGNALRDPPGDRVDVVLTNPPFGGVEEEGVERAFPAAYRTRATADLFLVRIVEVLKDGGRAAVVLPDGPLFGEGVKARVRQLLLRECDLHTVVRLPRGVFAPYTPIRTNLLFLTAGRPTDAVWFYAVPPPAGARACSRTRPLRTEDLAPVRAWWDDRRETEHAWRVSAAEIAADGHRLDRRHPRAGGEEHDDPDELLDRYRDADEAVREARDALRAELAEVLRERG